VFLRMAALVREAHIESVADLNAFVANLPSSTDRTVLQRFQRLQESSDWVLLESAIADLPADLRWLYETGAVTIAQLDALHDQLDVASLADLVDAVGSDALSSVPGFDEITAQAVEAALPKLRRSRRRIPLGRATAVSAPILEQIRLSPGVHWVEPAGSLRRAEDSVGDLEIVAAVDDPTPVSEATVRAVGVDRVLHRSGRRLYLLMNQVQVGVRFPKPAQAGATLLRLTGSQAHFRALQARAEARGWQLTRDGLRAADGAAVPAASEAEIYTLLDLPFIPPEIRSGGEEIEAAAQGALPRLLRRQDIRGDLHMHSLWSDGHDAIDAMIGGCRAMGYEYAAITDHSPRSGAARSLTSESVAMQRDEIAALREQLPDIAILHGCEVDILPDGRLDFPDRVLEQFDIVLASLHHPANQSSQDLLRRYTEAMHHPLVAVITHPANRSVPNNPGYDLDYDRLFEAAAQTGTCLEIDGAPGHLDMSGPLARRAVAAGVTVTVDSDSHRADVLGRQMALGVAMACRGWVEPRHVLNTRPLAEVRGFIARKRSGGTA
jgi:DNA polymerase (family 10)